MFLIVGLGNPGREYEETRHNVGFLVVETLADRTSCRVSDKKFKALTSRSRIQGNDCLLMKPQTYMNLSGESVGPALGFYKSATQDVIVIHDDLDVPLGQLKLKKGGGHGGHNGLRSLKKHLPDDGFIRIRVGIGRPPPRWDSADYVLSRFRNEEWNDVEEVVEKAADAVEDILKLGLPKAMGRYNQKPKREAATKEQTEQSDARKLRGSTKDNES